MISISYIDGQIHKKINFEIGINRSKVFNIKEIVSFQPIAQNGGSIVNISNESPSFSTNYNFALRYNFTGKHFVGLRYAHNTLGSLLTGNIEYFDDTGGQGLLVLEDSHNRVDSKSWGIIYEYQIPISKGKISLGLGIEKQSNKYYNSFVIIPGISYDNYTTHSAIGFIYPLIKYTSIHTKLFASQSFANNDNDDNPDASESAYIPLQVGLEIGIRIQLDEE